LEVRQKFEEKRFELLIGAVDFINQQDRRPLLPDRRKERPLEQIAFGENMLLDIVGIIPFTRFDGEQLALIVPLEKGRVLIEAFIALQAYEFRLVQTG